MTSVRFSPWAVFTCSENSNPDQRTNVTDSSFSSFSNWDFYKKYYFDWKPKVLNSIIYLFIYWFIHSSISSPIIYSSLHSFIYLQAFCVNFLSLYHLMANVMNLKILLGSWHLRHLSSWQNQLIGGINSPAILFWIWKFIPLIFFFFFLLIWHVCLSVYDKIFCTIKNNCFRVGKKLSFTDHRVKKQSWKLSSVHYRKTFSIVLVKYF